MAGEAGPFDLTCPVEEACPQNLERVIFAIATETNVENVDKNVHESVSFSHLLYPLPLLGGFCSVWCPITDKWLLSGHVCKSKAYSVGIYLVFSSVPHDNWDFGLVEPEIWP